MAKQKHRFIIVVETDNANISKKFPNWYLNYTSPLDFAKATVGMMMGRNSGKRLYGVVEDHMKEHGYRIEIEEYKKPWY